MDKPPYTIEINGQGVGHTAFPPHGHYKGQLLGQVIRDEATGPFNREMLVAFLALSKPLYTHAHSLGKFATLTVYRESMMMSPDALAELARLAADFAANKIAPVAVASVAAHDVEGRSMMARLFQLQVFEPAGIPYQFFDTIESAQQWVEEQLLEAKN